MGPEPTARSGWDRRERLPSSCNTLRRGPPYTEVVRDNQRAVDFGAVKSVSCRKPVGGKEIHIMRTKRASILFGIALVGCGRLFVEEPGELEVEQQATRWDGTGEEQQGTQLLGEATKPELGVRTTGTLGGDALVSLHVERGELVGKRLTSSGVVVVRGEAIAGAILTMDTHPAGSELLHIVEAMRGNTPRGAAPAADPKGDTWLYVISAISTNSLCKPDRHGQTTALPIAARWDPVYGDRLEPTSVDDRFSFACTSGVVAKCYMWGYRPWENPELKHLHQSCTRAARADYCGDGIPHTCEGTRINQFDAANYVPQTAVSGFFFEGGWSPEGARCLSRDRWASLRSSRLCTDYARRPGPHTYDKKQDFATPVVCDSVETVRAMFPDAGFFTESQLHPWPATCPP